MGEKLKRVVPALAARPLTCADLTEYDKFTTVTNQVRTMRTAQAISISLPPEMLKALEKARKAESRTRSELVREALRTYFSRRIPEELATPQEIRAIRRGQRELRRGKYVTLDDLVHEMGSRPRPVRKKVAPARS